jgi:hypothetical protein
LWNRLNLRAELQILLIMSHLETDYLLKKWVLPHQKREYLLIKFLERSRNSSSSQASVINLIKCLGRSLRTVNQIKIQSYLWQQMLEKKRKTCWVHPMKVIMTWIFYRQDLFNKMIINYISNKLGTIIIIIIIWTSKINRIGTKVN